MQIVQKKDKFSELSFLGGDKRQRTAEHYTASVELSRYTQKHTLHKELMFRHKLKVEFNIDFKQFMVGIDKVV